MWALALTSLVLAAEVIGGIVAGSLALLSDAAHAFTDAAALALALIANRLAQRPPDAERTFGYARFEVIAAAVNAAALLAAGGYILFEAVRRLTNPEPVESGLMLAVAVAGLIANAVSARLLSGGGGLNERGAYLEVISDLLGSIAVIIAAGLMLLTGWTWLDPVLAAGIGLWVIPRTWALLAESTNVLLEGRPPGLDLHALQERLEGIAGVEEVHDLHAWLITSGEPSLTAHLTAAPGADHLGILTAAQGVAAEAGIEHTTFQIDDAMMAMSEPHAHPRWERKQE